MKRYSVIFDGGLVVQAASHEMTDDALIFYDETGLEIMKIPASAIDTYWINEV